MCSSPSFEQATAQQLTQAMIKLAEAEALNMRALSLSVKSRMLLKTTQEELSRIGTAEEAGVRANYLAAKHRITLQEAEGDLTALYAELGELLGLKRPCCEDKK